MEGPQPRRPGVEGDLPLNLPYSASGSRPSQKPYGEAVPWRTHSGSKPQEEQSKESFTDKFTRFKERTSQKWSDYKVRNFGGDPYKTSEPKPEKPASDPNSLSGRLKQGFKDYMVRNLGGDPYR